MERATILPSGVAVLRSDNVYTVAHNGQSYTIMKWKDGDWYDLYVNGRLDRHADGTKEWVDNVLTDSGIPATVDEIVAAFPA